MDMSFARRQRRTKSAENDTPDLASLLAEMAARQSLSPTARIESARRIGQPLTAPEHDVDLLMSHGAHSVTPRTSSFNAVIAATMLTSGKASLPPH